MGLVLVQSVQPAEKDKKVDQLAPTQADSQAAEKVETKAAETAPSSPASSRPQQQQQAAQTLLQKISEDSVEEKENSSPAHTTSVSDDKETKTAAGPNKQDTQDPSAPDLPETAADVPSKDKTNGDKGLADGDVDAGDSNKTEEEPESGLAALKYEPTQYHPISNRSGKKIYSRQFMLDVCEKICKLDLSQTDNDDRNSMGCQSFAGEWKGFFSLTANQLYPRRSKLGAKVS